jgi:hypothetical protein
MQGEFDFDEKPSKGKTREQLQDDLKKYGITPRPGYDPKGPNLPDNVDRPSTTREKYAAKAAENQEFKDKRVKASPLTVSSELAKMKEILSKPKGGGGGGGIPSDKMDKMKKMNYKSGGTVKSSASKRADGCAIRGKTRA